MSTWQTVYDGQGRKAGSYNDQGSVVYGYDRNGRILGNYNKSSNQTMDTYKRNRRYGMGNMITALIMEYHNNPNLT